MNGSGSRARVGQRADSPPLVPLLETILPSFWGQNRGQNSFLPSPRMAGNLAFFDRLREPKVGIALSVPHPTRYCFGIDLVAFCRFDSGWVFALPVSGPHAR